MNRWDILGVVIMLCALAFLSWSGIKEKPKVRLFVSYSLNGRNVGGQFLGSGNCFVDVDAVPNTDERLRAIEAALLAKTKEGEPGTEKLVLVSFQVVPAAPQ